MTADSHNDSSMPRRKFLQLSAATVGAVGGLGAGSAAQAAQSQSGGRIARAARRRAGRAYNGMYSGEHLSQVAFPLGGIGAGMICLEGTGTLSHVSLRNRPDMFNSPCVFAAISVKGKHRVARVLEGPVPGRKLYGPQGAGNGLGGTTYGLPRFANATFKTRFPFGVVALTDPQLPLSVELTGWSPFEPGDADNSSLPVAALEYRFTNRSRNPLDAVFSFNAKNFMATGGNPQAVRPIAGGFILWGGGSKDNPWDEAALSATVSEPGTKVNHAWFRGGWWDALTLAWKDVAEGTCYERAPVTEGDPSPGATLFVPFQLAAGASKTIAVRLAWFVGQTNLRIGKDPAGLKPEAAQREHYRPWYGGRFTDVNGVSFYWRDHYTELRQKASRFADCFYDSTLPPEIIEAVAANLTILKSPTVMRQTDGRLWGWEGCHDNSGCCHGSCTHVWNYAQAIPHLFPSLERTLRETEFGPSQNEAGHQQFRSALPIRPLEHDFHAAADGQLGGIMKVFRDWRISGDTEWLRRLWPKVKRSLQFCIETWDPGHKGIVEEPHHNTYDIEFWGPDGMCTSFYLGALQAAVLMGNALGDEVPLHAELLAAGIRKAESELFDGEYFIQRIDWTGLKAGNPLENKSMMAGYSPEARAIFEKEGPKYQYGTGCLSDGVLGSWLALVCGVGQVLAAPKVASHLQAVHRYNLKHDLSDFANPQRPTYACGAEGGLVLCTWPKGGELSLPFVYSNEVWTGIEYQVASHLMRMGLVREGLEVVRVCRDRYDGRVRNPFNEYECGHWYARAMSSYALLFGLSGARYDAVEKVLHLEPRVRGDYRCFLATATGYGIVGVRKGKPFYEDKAGTLDIRDIKYVKYAA
ncbi:MAG TPA: GH116 family glycosyl hydrolase [Verrucomicrobiota bacterium]|nr:GH116 family glycosyl hydrolase [Verrucomicrobiota bacterium]HQL78079.1 GH116 family glycosyl hydrolase [Verrucomicrobiota bacterium]